MSLQRKHFLLSYFKTLSVGLAGVWTYNLPHGSPAIYQLSQPFMTIRLKFPMSRSASQAQPFKILWSAVQRSYSYLFGIFNELFNCSMTSHSAFKLPVKNFQWAAWYWNTRSLIHSIVVCFTRLQEPINLFVDVFAWEVTCTQGVPFCGTMHYAVQGYWNFSLWMKSFSLYNFIHVCFLHFFVFKTRLESFAMVTAFMTHSSRHVIQWPQTYSSQIWSARACPVKLAVLASKPNFSYTSAMVVFSGSTPNKEIKTDLSSRFQSPLPPLPL